MEFIPDDKETMHGDLEQHQIQHLNYLKQRDWFVQLPSLYYERRYIVAARMEAHENRMVEIKQRHIKKLLHLFRLQNKTWRTGAVRKHVLSIKSSRLPKIYSQASMCVVSPKQSRPLSSNSEEDMHSHEGQFSSLRVQFAVRLPLILPLNYSKIRKSRQSLSSWIGIFSSVFE